MMGLIASPVVHHDFSLSTRVLDLEGGQGLDTDPPAQNSVLEPQTIRNQLGGRTMKHKTKFVVTVMWVLSLAVLMSTSAVAQSSKDVKEALGIDYDLRGRLNPAEGHHFPKSWGRLVNLLPIGGDLDWVFLFEAEDGTVRIVSVDLNWRKFDIDAVRVLTIGRE